MRLLLLTETVPWPLDGGGRIKTWHTLNALAREHEVHCHAFVRTEAQRAAAVEPLRQACASATLHLVARSLPREAFYFGRCLVTGLPFTISRHFERRVLHELARACRALRIDAVYCDHLSMFEYCRRLDVPIVHDAHNVEHRIVRRYAASLPRLDPRRLILARESRRLAEYEAAMYARAALIFAVSDVDAAEISALSGGRVSVVPVPIAVDAGTLPRVERLTDSPQVLFVGALDWPPNADAVRYCVDDVWPLVRARRPDARLVVVGRGGPALSRRWPGAAGVEFAGHVPDVAPWFDASRVTVVPLRSGSGMRVKILDAFARGVPVVTTPVGVEGIAAEPGVHALVAETPDALAASVVRILEERPLAERLAAAARQLVLDRYDVRVVGRLQLETLRAWQQGGAGRGQARRTP